MHKGECFFRRTRRLSPSILNADLILFAKDFEKDVESVRTMSESGRM